MALTFEEVCERLADLDEVTLLEVLNISSKEIIEKFQDKIEDNLEVMPSMRLMMTAGEACERDNIAAYNCS